ncbi:putative movement protein [Gerbera capillovirus A]|nr:putative movement protein [Gerbera capillovirus A]
MSIVPVSKFLNELSKSNDSLYVDALHSKYFYSDINSLGKPSHGEVRRFQSSISIPATGRSGILSSNFQCFDQAEIEFIRSKAREYGLIHLGGMLFTITCLFKLRKGINGRLIYLDERFCAKTQAFQSSFEFNISRGQAHFLYSPDYPISTSDPNLDKASRIIFEFDGIEMLEGSFAFNVDIGIIYRFTNQIDFKPVRANVRELVGQEIKGTRRLVDLSEEDVEEISSNSMDLSLRAIDDRLVPRKRFGRSRKMFNLKTYRGELLGLSMCTRIPDGPLLRSNSCRLHQESGGVHTKGRHSNFEQISKKDLQFFRSTGEEFDKRSKFRRDREKGENREGDECSFDGSGDNQTGCGEAVMGHDRSWECSTSNSRGGGDLGCESEGSQKVYLESLHGLSSGECGHFRVKPRNSIPIVQSIDSKPKGDWC